MIKSKILANSDGFSYIEIFVYILLITLISTLSVTTLGTINRTIEINEKSVINSNEILNMKNKLTLEIEKIKPPYFITKELYSIENNIIKVYYYNGVRSNYIEFDCSGKFITVSLNEEVFLTSKYISGKFYIEKNFIVYQDGDIILKFPFGRIIV